GRRAAFALGPERVRPLHHAPAIVAAALDAVDHFPQVLANLADPQVAGSPIKAVPPRLAQPIGPHLAPRPLLADEGIVLRNPIALFRIGFIHIDAKDRAGQVAEVLPGMALVGDTAAVAGANVEVAVAPELEAAAIVPTRRPGDYHLLRCRITAWRIARHLEARHARSLRLVLH